MTAPTPAIRLGELSPAEARAVLDRYVAGQPERLAAFRAEVERRGGPADRLDLSIGSLGPLWRWFLEEHRPRRWFGGPHRMPSTPASDEQLRRSDPPWWYDHHPELGQILGPYLARLVTGLADYFFACAIHARPGSRWALGTGRTYAYFQHPVLGLEGRGERDYANPLFAALQGLRGQANDDPDALQRLLERWLGMDPAYEAEMERLARPLAVYAVSAVERGRFTHEVAFDDVVAHRQERRIAGLVAGLEDEPAVEEAVHEDREVILVRAPTLSVSDLEQIVAVRWKRRAAGRSHADPA